MVRRSETKEDPKSMGYDVPPENLLKFIDLQIGLDYIDVSWPKRNCSRLSLTS